MKKARFFFVIAALVAILSGCTTAAAESNPAEATGRLNISAEQDEGSGFCWSEEDLGGNAPEITVDGLSDLTIMLDGSEYPLDEAIRTGRITGEEIIAYAQIDARADICFEKAMTENGLTWLRYRYPAFDLYVCNDVLQTPKHGDYRVKKIRFADRSVSFDLADVGYVDTETGVEPIDYEDWGLTLTVTEATPTAATIHTVQSGGQQFGSLVTADYSIRMADSAEYVTMADNADELFPQIAITMGGEDDFVLDWSALIGELPAGDYVLRLYIRDEYDESSIPALAKNFYDQQYFELAFTVK